jgi:outer membrane lipoprotein-sorting protein
VVVQRPFIDVLDRGRIENITFYKKKLWYRRPGLLYFDYTPEGLRKVVSASGHALVRYGTFSESTYVVSKKDSTSVWLGDPREWKSSDFFGESSSLVDSAEYIQHGLDMGLIYDPETGAFE